MIATIRGEIIMINDASIVVECGGIGYEMQVTASALANCDIGSEIFIYTYMQVREDGVSLFGFASKAEKMLFEKLIGVSGVGPKGAMSILSQLGYDGLQLAIATDDHKAIAKSPGIGNKTAQKIILELHDKINIEDVIRGGNSSPVSPVKMNAAISDACMALTALGFKETESMSVIKSIPNADEMDADELLTLALKKLV